MPHYFKIPQVFFLAMIKYFYAPIYGVEIGMSFWENFFSLISGGVLAFLIYYHFSKIVLILSRRLDPIMRKILTEGWYKAYWRYRMNRRLKKRKRRKFTRVNKFMIKIRRNYGMWGIILLTPVLLSLPVGAFLLRKYYDDDSKAIPFAILSIIVEGFILCVVFSFLPRI